MKYRGDGCLVQVRMQIRRDGRAVYRDDPGMIFNTAKGG
jgi:hypothetical protein